MKLLFVCSGNVSRSRTAEEVFRVLTWGVPGRAGHEARSAGTDPEPGGRPLTIGDLAWADIVCVMEPVHEAHIRTCWPEQAGKVRVLGIPDDYDPGDPELQDLLTRHIVALLGAAGGPARAG